MKQIYHVVTKDFTTTLLDTQSFINFIKGINLDKCVICVSEVSDDDYASMIRMQSEADHPQFADVPTNTRKPIGDYIDAIFSVQEPIEIYPNLRSILGFGLDYHDRRKNGFRHKGYGCPKPASKLQKHLFKQFVNKNGERLVIVSIDDCGLPGIIVKTQFV